MLNAETVSWVHRLGSLFFWLHGRTEVKPFPPHPEILLVLLLGTVMCFGQTGAGKTYTMTGATESYKQRGIIPRALQEVDQDNLCHPTLTNNLRHVTHLKSFNPGLHWLPVFFPAQV